MSRRRVYTVGAAIAVVAAIVLWRVWPRRKQTEIRFDVPVDDDSPFVIHGGGREDIAGNGGE